MTQLQLDRLVAKWQKLLLLDEWAIVVSLKRDRDMPLEESLGTVGYCLPKKEAIICVLDPIDYDGVIEQDIEKTIVHELVHLRLARLDDKTENEIDVEQATELLARSIVAIHRGEARRSARAAK